MSISGQGRGAVRKNMCAHVVCTGPKVSGSGCGDLRLNGSLYVTSSLCQLLSRGQMGSVELLERMVRRIWVGLLRVPEEQAAGA